MKIFATIFLVMLLVPFALADISEIQSIRVSMINQEPDPVEIGEHLVARFRVENMGSQPFPDMKISVDAAYPFVTATGEKSVGTLAGRQIDKVGAVVSFDLIVDQGATDGLEKVYLNYRSGDGSPVKVGPFNISIRSRTAVASIVSVDSSPQIISPGQRANLTFDIANRGRSSLRDVFIKLDLSGTVPFAPIGMSQERSLALLKQGETSKVRFSLITTSDAEAGVYKVPVSIQYADQSGRNYSRSDLVSLIIGGTPQIHTLISEQDTLIPGEKGEITVQVVNDGLVNAKLASIELNESSGYRLLSPSQIYVGDLDSDDFDSVQFTLFISKEVKQITIPATLKYRDSNNIEYERQTSFSPKIYSSKEAQEVGLKEASMIGWVLAIVVIVAGFLVYKRLRKRQ